MLTKPPTPQFQNEKTSHHANNDAFSASLFFPTEQTGKQSSSQGGNKSADEKVSIKEPFLFLPFVEIRNWETGSAFGHILCRAQICLSWFNLSS
jgi:hypothetical protein